MAPAPLSGSARFNKDQDTIDARGILKVGEEEQVDAKYPKFLPTWDKTEFYPPYEVIDYSDKGLLADPEFKNLYGSATGKLEVNDISPKFGTEIKGVQLSTLSDEAKNDLALLAAKRGVLLFRNQDFKELELQEMSDFVKYYGRLHIHPSSGQPEGYPEFHVIFRRRNDGQMQKYFTKRTTSVAWHSDVTFEKQPPGITFLTMLESPKTGGDTIFADTTEAYERLSPKFQKILSTLKATHSAHEQAEESLAVGGIVRRKPIITSHPIVRVHPVTGKKSLYVNPQFTRTVEGLKEEESEYLLNFLYTHATQSPDFQIRAKWEPNTVVVWDNRRALHSAIYDFLDSKERRHGIRLTPQAEVPFNHDI